MVGGGAPLFWRPLFVERVPIVPICGKSRIKGKDKNVTSQLEKRANTSLLVFNYKGAKSNYEFKAFLVGNLSI
jgi:hypothetical protein